MNLKQQLKEKNSFLRKAYDTAYEYNPASPLTITMNPKEFGAKAGFDEVSTERIMSELADDGYIVATIGMDMLMLTRSGLDYLRNIEDEPMSASRDAGKVASPMTKRNSPFMKQSEKLDLMLRELYRFKNDGMYYSLTEICETRNIPLDSVLELNKMAHRLQDEGFINTSFTHNDCHAELTSHGVEYCEENSYAYSGHSLITNNYSISITNSPHSTIVNQSTNVAVTHSVQDIDEIISHISKTISTDKNINQETASDILECVNEIRFALNNNQKPKFAIRALIEMASGISSIGSWVTTLGQVAGLVPS